MRVSSMVKRQWILAPSRLRSADHAATSRLRVSMSANLCLRHWRTRIENSTSYHAQPRSMHRGIDEFDPPGQTPGLFRGEGLVEGCRRVGGEVVQDYQDALGLRVDLLG